MLEQIAAQGMFQDQGQDFQLGNSPKLLTLRAAALPPLPAGEGAGGEGRGLSSTIETRPAERSAGAHEGFSGAHEGFSGAHEGYRGAHEGCSGAHEGYRGAHEGFRGVHEGYRGAHEGYRGAHEGFRGAHEGFAAPWKGLPGRYLFSAEPLKRIAMRHHAAHTGRVFDRCGMVLKQEGIAAATGTPSR
jgi:hypothetical protein